MASKTSNTTTASWLAWNLKQIPLALKCQINNEKSQIFPNTNLYILGKTGGYLQLRTSLFDTAQSLFRTILDQGSSLLSQSCNSCAVAFCKDPGSNGTNNKDTLTAVDIRAEMGQITSTAWKNNLCTLLLLHLQYWHLCS